MIASLEDQEGEGYMAELSPTTRDALLRVGTSTLTGVLSRRGLRNLFMQDVWPIRPDLPRMVGADRPDILHEQVAQAAPREDPGQGRCPDAQQGITGGWGQFRHVSLPLLVFE